ncbi:TetR/AcrR family transcriptional regulator [Microbacterium betulae]|uniref:TetR/AcrR family transcriptional regulator n=1 Tax=Microbacterium betulae TaxID=2981139 RepID=A0AA97FEQ9_9MICO|nr:TetR/AcrR family transcriptional regulator [Microbacterium sp. AB]WOF22146.1 TetR/AcrR family transcriptional regulator [Microbacterium sp. AB]
MGYAKGRSRRHAIVEAAILLFAEVGYHAASLRELASRVGMTHPGLLHHFPDKAALLQAVLAYRDESDRAAVDEEAQRGIDPIESFVRIVERNALRRPLIEAFAALEAEATTEGHPAHRYFADRSETTMAEIRDEFFARAERGELAPGLDPEHVARNFAALMDGLQIQWLYSLGSEGRERVDMAAHLRSYLSAVLRERPA